MPAQCLPPTDQSEDDDSTVVPSLPPMIPAVGPIESEYATAASTQQERYPSTLCALPAHFSPVMTVLFNRGEKDEEKYMSDLNHSVDPICGDCRNTIRSEATMPTSATAVI
eukprot:10099570-Ditylum_brightwellii.AAC.1